MGRKIILIFILPVFLFLISGCTEQPSQKTASEEVVEPLNESNVKKISMTIYHTGYDPSRITVNEGEEIKILVITALGTAAHNHGITIDAYGINRVVTSEDANNPVIIEFVADKTGKFKIYCNSCKEGIYGNAHPDIRATLEVK